MSIIPVHQQLLWWPLQTTNTKINSATSQETIEAIVVAVLDVEGTTTTYHRTWTRGWRISGMANTTTGSSNKLNLGIRIQILVSSNKLKHLEDLRTSNRRPTSLNKPCSLHATSMKRSVQCLWLSQHQIGTWTQELHRTCPPPQVTSILYLNRTLEVMLLLVTVLPF